MYIWKADRASGTHSNTNACLCVFVCLCVCACMRVHTSLCVCVCVCVCNGVEAGRVICGCTSAALNCIKQLRDLFYDCNMRYLTYHCHKAQQMHRQQTRGTTVHAHMQLDKHTATHTHTHAQDLAGVYRKWAGWFERAVFKSTWSYKGADLWSCFLFAFCQPASQNKVGQGWYHRLHLFSPQPYNHNSSLLRRHSNCYWNINAACKYHSPSHIHISDKITDTASPCWGLGCVFHPKAMLSLQNILNGPPQQL